MKGYHTGSGPTESGGCCPGGSFIAWKSTRTAGKFLFVLQVHQDSAKISHMSLSEPGQSVGGAYQGKVEVFMDTTKMAGVDGEH